MLSGYSCALARTFRGRDELQHNCAYAPDIENLTLAETVLIGTCLIVVLLISAFTGVQVSIRDI